MSHDTLIPRINNLNEQEFIALLGGVYEHSPWVAEAAWQRRPFKDRDQLLEVMQSIVLQAAKEKQLALICAHPILGAARLEMLTASSRAEQRGAHLDQLGPADLAEFATLNQSYMNRFGFPFILAIKGKTLQDIRSSMQERLENSMEQEFQRCIAEIGQIARQRISAL